MVGAGWENFVLWFSGTQENTFLDAFSKNFVFVPQMLFCSAEKWIGHGPPPPPASCAGPDQWIDSE